MYKEVHLYYTEAQNMFITIKYEVILCHNCLSSLYFLLFPRQQLSKV